VSDEHVKLFSFGGGRKVYDIPEIDLAAVNIITALVLIGYACFGAYSFGFASLPPAVPLGIAPGVGLLLRMIMRSVISEARLCNDTATRARRPFYDRFGLPAYLTITAAIILWSIRTLI